MHPQYPLEPTEQSQSRPAITSVDFYDGRRLCTDERMIRNTWQGQVVRENNYNLVCRQARVLAWFRGTPITAVATYNNGYKEVYVAESLALEETPMFTFGRRLSNGRLAYSVLKVDDIDRVHNRMMDLVMLDGEYHVDVWLEGSPEPFYMELHNNEVSWKLLGPRQTKQQVKQDLLKNFNSVMESISREIKIARGNCYDPITTNHTFFIWETHLHAANVERVKRAIESTGWTVVKLESEGVDIILVIK